jgi:hypothetical protein
MELTQSYQNFLRNLFSYFKFISDDDFNLFGFKLIIIIIIDFVVFVVIYLITLVELPSDFTIHFIN